MRVHFLGTPSRAHGALPLTDAGMAVISLTPQGRWRTSRASSLWALRRPRGPGSAKPPSRWRRPCTALRPSAFFALFLGFGWFCWACGSAGGPGFLWGRAFSFMCFILGSKDGTRILGRFGGFCPWKPSKLRFPSKRRTNPFGGEGRLFEVLKLVPLRPNGGGNSKTNALVLLKVRGLDPWN